MSTGRQVIEAALREPMSNLGWMSRARGWFTAPVTARMTGVVTVGTASKHAAVAAAFATLYVGIPDEGVEPIVAALCGKPDTYRDRTAVATIGYLMPDPRWREWQVDERTAYLVAGEMVAAFRDYGLPYVKDLATNAETLLAAAKTAPGYAATAVGGCRVAVLLAANGRPNEARELIDSRIANLGDRHDPNAAHERAVAARFTEWLRQEQHDGA